MMDRLCPACRVSLEGNVTTSGQCLACGHDLVVTAPPPRWVLPAGVDLRLAARRQRMLLWFILAQIGFYAALMYFANVMPAVSVVLLFVMLATQIGVVVCVLQLQAALAVHTAWRILTGIFLFAPCISLLVLLAVNSRATSALQRAGLVVGFMGVRDEEVVKLLGASRCRHCSYLLVGNTSGICPECGTPVNG